ncbi:MAG: 16S rRNA (cytosine(967)-C(5))-methyltransferase RsmB [Streptococcaceae bacterium]|jgi:16S rRNA (cytosine967-C5)-methyltransferase|nr:16S rRNA (cytosine(967)-C(5))-methyltransferase RsmB [Streptococcaceae bacterium]
MSKKKVPKRILNNPRYLAMQALVKIESGDAYSNLLLNELIASHEIPDVDKGLFTELVYGTTARKLTLDFYLKPFIKNMKKVDQWVKQLLYLSIYQMEFLDRVPDHAILNDAVEIAKAYGNQGIGKFVNGVLRNIQRSELPNTNEMTNKVKRLSIEASMPEWLINKLIRQYGFETTEQLAFSLLKPAKSSGRLDLKRITRNEAIKQLEEQGLDVEKSEVSPYGVVASKGAFAKTWLFREGTLTVQDESSMLVAPTLELTGSEKVLDACAAPGGKTTHIAQLLDDGAVTALDIYEHKVKLIEENAQRLGLSDKITTQIMDAQDVAQQFAPESFDAILVDAPCSGLGLMRRKPDIKYNKSTQDFKELPKIQLNILESCAKVLKSAGILTYSTCTIVKEENEEVVEKFLKNHPEFTLMTPKMNEKMSGYIKENLFQILPQDEFTDGFFISVFKKN